jgi:hypothetical protein
MALEGADHRLVGPLEDLLDDPAEVADRLVVVEDEGERDPLVQVPFSDVRWACSATLAAR